MIDSFSFVDVTSGAPLTQGGVAVLGNFDGVHLGHRSVLRAACVRAHKEGLKVCALTLDPHPTAFFQKDKTPFLLSPPKIKTRLLREACADEVLVLPFTPEFASLRAEDFIEQVLIQGLAPKHVVVGFDFAFGASRRGDQKFLREFLAPHGVDVIDVPPWKDSQGEIISSTRVREAMKRGDPLLARQLLGRPFAIEGEIIHGNKRGREIGFPTANIDMSDYIRPLFGVYAGKARLSGHDKEWPAVINIGNRPTVDGSKELMEAHILGFDQDIYGQNWSIELWAFLRPEMKFAGLHALKDQISKDAAEAHRFSGI